VLRQDLILLGLASEPKVRGPGDETQTDGFYSKIQFSCVINISIFILINSINIKNIIICLINIIIFIIINIINKKIINLKKIIINMERKHRIYLNGKMKNYYYHYH